MSHHKKDEKKPEPSEGWRHGVIPEPDDDTEGHRGRSLIEEPSPEGLHGRSLTVPTDEDDTEGHRGRA